jgi:hypothetical protein
MVITRLWWVRLWQVAARRPGRQVLRFQLGAQRSVHHPASGAARLDVWQLCGHQPTDQADRASSLVTTGALVGSSAPLGLREAGNCSTVAC